MRTLSRLSLIAAIAAVLAPAASATPPIVLHDLPELVPAQVEFKPGDLGFMNEVDEPIVCPPHAPQQTSASTLGELLHGARRDIPDGDARGYTPPQPLQVPPAEYPASDWLMGVEGHVRLALLIDEAGRVLTTETVCATNERFELEALKAVSAAHYRPAVRDGRRIAGIAIQPFDFNLD